MPKYAHTSIYIGAAVKQIIKEIAAEQECKSHDLLVEGLALVLARYGRQDAVDHLFEYGFARGRLEAIRAIITDDDEKEATAA